MISFAIDFILPSTGVPYQLDQLANNQPKLSAFFALKSSPHSPDASPCTPVCLRIPEAEDSSFKGGTSIDAYFSDVGESIEHSGLISGESDNLMNKNSNASLVEQPASSCGKPSEVTMAKPSNCDVEVESSVRNELQSIHYQPSALVSSNFMDNHNMKGSPSSTVDGPSNQRHSTLEDPNFVENYFKVPK